MKRNRFPAAPEWARHPINMNHRKNPMALKPRPYKLDVSRNWRGEGSTEEDTTTPGNKSPPLSPSQQQQQQQHRSEDGSGYKKIGNLQKDNAERYSFQREQLRILREQEARQSSSSPFPTSASASGSSNGDGNQVKSPVSNEDKLLKYVTEAGSSNATTARNREPSSSSPPRLVPYKSQQQKISRNTSSSSPYSSSTQKDSYNGNTSSSTSFKQPSATNTSGRSSRSGRNADRGFMVESTGDAVTDLGNELSLDELRTLCKRLGLPVSGLKVELAERIIEFKARKTGGQM